MFRILKRAAQEKYSIVCIEVPKSDEVDSLLTAYIICQAIENYCNKECYIIVGDIIYQNKRRRDIVEKAIPGFSLRVRQNSEGENAAVILISHRNQRTKGEVIGQIIRSTQRLENIFNVPCKRYKKPVLTVSVFKALESIQRDKRLKKDGRGLVSEPEARVTLFALLYVTANLSNGKVDENLLYESRRLADLYKISYGYIRDIKKIVRKNYVPKTLDKRQKVKIYLKRMMLETENGKLETFYACRFYSTENEKSKTNELIAEVKKQEAYQNGYKCILICTNIDKRKTDIYLIDKECMITIKELDCVNENEAYQMLIKKVKA